MCYVAYTTTSLTLDTEKEGTHGGGPRFASRTAADPRPKDDVHILSLLGSAVEDPDEDACVLLAELLHLLHAHPGEELIHPLR